MIPRVLLEKGSVGELLEKVGRRPESKATRGMLEAAYHEFSRVLSMLFVLCVESLADNAAHDGHRIWPGRHEGLSQKIVELVRRSHRRSTRGKVSLAGTLPRAAGIRRYCISNGDRI